MVHKGDLSKYKVELIPIALIDISQDPGRWVNVRKKNPREGIVELAKSIQDHGLLQPIVVYREGERYELILGQRRLIACRDELHRDEIPARVLSVGRIEAIVLSFSENIYRLELDYSDKMRAALELRNALGSVDKVAKALDVSSQTVRNYLGFAGVPDALKKMVGRKLSAQTATDIAKNISDEKVAVEVAKKITEAERGERRGALIRAVKESPEKSLSAIVRTATAKGRKTTVWLSAKIADALDSACQDRKAERDEIVSNALEEWLADEGFLK
jgi:ParB family chromosome partitioning protein